MGTTLYSVFYLYLKKIIPIETYPVLITVADFYLYPRPPFDFSLSASIFAGGDPQIRTYEHAVFRQVLNVRNNPVLTEVSSEGSVDEPALRISPRTDNPLPESAIRDLGNIISSIFNINDEITTFYKAVEGDEVMAVLTHRLRGLKPPTTPTVFEALVDSVIEQQISLKAAHSIENRLIRSVGKSLTIEKNTWYSYPTPHILAHLPDSTFRSCGLTIRKGEYIREISHSILAGALDLDRFKTYPDTESIISEMVKIRGVGRWTAELTILRGLHRPDAFPADDIGVRRFISQYYRNGEKTTSVEARAIAEHWGAWKGFAAFYLEVADLLRIDPEKLQKNI